MSTGGSCFSVSGGGILLRVRGRPRADRDQVAGMHGGELVVRVRAAAEGGRANEAIVRVLAEALGLRQAEIVLKRGAGSPRKVFALPSSARAGLERLEGGP